MLYFTPTQLYQNTKKAKDENPFSQKVVSSLLLIRKNKKSFVLPILDSTFSLEIKIFFFREIRVFHLAETDFMLAPSAHISEDFSNTAATPFDLRSNETLINGPFIG